MADNQNYGNEPDAFSLIYPSDALNGGLEEDEFLCLRSKSELEELFEGSNSGLEGRGKHIFEAIFDYATRDLDADAKRCSASQFLKAKRELDMKALGF